MNIIKKRITYMSDKTKFYQAVAMLIGMTVGAGILGIPYVVSQAGFLIGLAIILFVGFLVLLINLAVGEVCLRTKGNHQLTGYAQKYLGKWGRFFMLISIFFGFYGALIAYVLGEGASLSAIFNYPSLVFSISFIAIVAAILYFDIKIIGRSELALMSVKVLLFLGIIFVSFKALKAENLIHINPAQLFLPYGVILFAFTGSASVPEMKEALFGQEKKLRKAIFTGMGIVTAIYLIFALVVVGVSGKEVTEVATLGMAKLLGNKILIMGNLFAIIAMTTSYIAVGYALKETLIYDLKIDKFFSWFLVNSVPLLAFLILYVFDWTSFITIIGISGAIAGGLSFVLIMLMHQNAKKFGDKEPEYTLKLSKAHSYVIIGFLTLATIIYLITLI